jgi:hypothetical protein
MRTLTKIPPKTFYYISKQNLRPSDREDCEQEVRIGLSQLPENVSKTYLEQTGIGIVKHWLRDRLSLIRIPTTEWETNQASNFFFEHILVDVYEDVLPAVENVPPTYTDKTVCCLEQIRLLLPILTKGQQKVMKLALEGMDTMEIADMLRLEYKSVQKTQWLALKAIRQYFIDDTK